MLVSLATSLCLVACSDTEKSADSTTAPEGTESASADAPETPADAPADEVTSVATDDAAKEEAPGERPNVTYYAIPG